MNIKVINAFHVLVIGSLLCYIGFTGDKTPKEVYYAVFALSLVIFAVSPRPNLKGLNYWNIIHWVHYIIVVPGFIYLSYAGINKKLSKTEYNSLKYIGAGIALYHGYKLGTRLMK